MKRLDFLDTASPDDLDDIQLLEKLRRRLNNSRTEQYCGFLDMKGENCAYVQRSLEKFQDLDLPDIMELVKLCWARLKELDE